MKRYRAVRGKEAPWQTKAVKSAVHLFRGTFDIEDSGTESSETEYAEIENSGRRGAGSRKRTAGGYRQDLPSGIWTSGENCP